MRSIAKVILTSLLFSLLSIVPVEAQRHQGARQGHEQSASRGGERRSGVSRTQGGHAQRKDPAVARPSHNSAVSRPGRPAVDNKQHNNVGNIRPGGQRPGGNNNGNRPGNNNGNRPGNNDNNRPGNNNGNGQGHNPGHGDGFRPGNGHGQGHNPGHGDGFRPGNGHGQGHNPGHGDGFRPGNGPGQGHNPGHGNGFPPGHNPGKRPGPGHGFGPGHHHGPSHGYGPGGRPRPPMMIPPRRPGRPQYIAPWYRPTPPPAWRPYVGAPSFATILGITIGTAIGTSLDYLYNGGYVVDGYNANQIYLRDVSQLNYMWPDATLYYGPQGGLTGSEYMYSTPGYNTSRYYSVYNNLIGLYGPPAVILNPSGGMGATWFGPNGAFVTLKFAPASAYGGLRYFTTLTFGL